MSVGKAAMVAMPKAPASSCANPFFAPWFIAAAERHLLGADALRFIGLSSVGALPVMRRGKIGGLPFGHDQSLPLDHCFCGDSIADDAAGEQPVRDLFLRLVPEDSSVHAALCALPGATILKTRRRAFVTGGQAYESWEKETLSARKRKGYRRLARRLEEEGAVAEEWLTGGSELSQWTEEFIALEGMGWKRETGTAFGCDPKQRAFLHDALTGAAEAGALLFYRKTVDGKPIAMLISFRGGDIIYTFKIAHDPAFEKYSPGVHAMLAVARRMMDDGLAQACDSCADEDHPMIDALWPERRILHDWFIPVTGAGRAFVAPMLKRHAAWKRTRKAKTQVQD